MQLCLKFDLYPTRKEKKGGHMDCDMSVPIFPWILKGVCGSKVVLAFEDIKGSKLEG